ncbi:motile sperm domain-containing protein 1-like [Tenebrio molitor]|uniref:motile sperm domain-containing protein 1-like n=1 Tax=Tenebrio molitor TaxID=7067 RepID=UPI003624843C
MATRKQPTNFIISPSELKVYRDSTEPVKLSIFNCYEFFVQCNVLIWSTNSFAVKKSKMIIGPRSHASIVLTYTGSREGCSIEKHMFQIVIRDVNTREVIGIRRIIASIFPSEEQPKEECFVSEDSGEKGSTRSVVQVNLEEQKEEEYSGLDDTLVQQNIENSPQHNTSETEEAAEYWAQHKELKDEASNSTKSLGALNNENEKPK